MHDIFKQTASKLDEELDKYKSPQGDSLTIYGMMLSKTGKPIAELSDAGDGNAKLLFYKTGRFIIFDKRLAVDLSKLLLTVHPWWSIHRPMTNFVVVMLLSALFAFLVNIFMR